jgi:hypothetical protein
MNNAIDRINFEEIFAENGADAISAVTEMITSQQNIALGLTKLVLEHCVEDKISKEELFDIYDEAFDFLKTQNEDIV